MAVKCTRQQIFTIDVVECSAMLMWRKTVCFACRFNLVVWLNVSVRQRVRQSLSEDVPECRLHLS